MFSRMPFMIFFCSAETFSSRDFVFSQSRIFPFKFHFTKLLMGGILFCVKMATPVKSVIYVISPLSHLGADNGTFGREIAIIGQLFADNGTFGQHRRFSRGAVIGTLFKVPPPVPGAG